MTPIILALAGALIVAAVLIRRRTGIPWRRVTYTDTGAWRRAETSLIARRYRLVGKPDYLIEQRGRVIPVEVKPTRQAEVPYPSDTMQLAAYCLLVEESMGTRPPYGLLRYHRSTFKITFDDRLRNQLLALLDEMHAAEPKVISRRSHNEPGRCAHCGFQRQCDEALV